MSSNINQEAREKYYTTHFRNFQDSEVNESIINYYTRKFSNIFPNNKEAQILEIGTGLGKFMFTLKSLGYTNIEGIDVSDEMVEIARRNSGEKITLVKDVNSYVSNCLHKYDFVFMLDVIEHIHKSEVISTLTAIRNSLKNDGILIITTENMASPIGRIQEYLDFTHEYNYSEVTLEQVLLIAGFNDIKIWSLPDKMPHSPRALFYWICRRIWFKLLRFLNELERPGCKITKIFGKELIASAKA
jgi:2-polyprenyl-3-methyl-5-hydroxy-6-metoxy-1,4-benzoquinol methylase